ncbi:DUF2207 domain-containing protein [Candidatus Saccharibacteria bacterium]|nr:DUF2207 domain-containing protein [Candidatus Saccharibacteria bacterium]
MLKRAVLSFAIVTVSLLWVAPVISADSLNNFVITSYDIEYRLGQDDEKRSILMTRETIVADFPESDQNHGLERAIPYKYDGHSTSLKIKSIKDGGGKKWEYSTSRDGSFENLRIGDADKYVHGKQTFVIEYTQRDVTKAFSDSGNIDEFYWNTNGTYWKVPIENLSVQLDIDQALRPKLTGKTACYQGAFGNDETCSLKQENGIFTVQAENLAAGENVTMAIGFKPETFAEYKMSLFEKLLIGWFKVQGALLILAAVIVTWLMFRFYRIYNRKSEQKPVVTQYLPPKNTSIETSARLLKGKNSFAALLIDLAVRHYLKIYQTTKGKSIFKTTDYEIEITKPVSELNSEEQEVLSDIFNKKPEIGDRLEMKKLKIDTKLYERMKDNTKKLDNLIQNNYGLRNKDEAQSAWFRRFALLTLVAGLITLSPVLLVLAMIVFAMSRLLLPLTDKGLELVRHLNGLKKYIGVAEQERLKMLQSPEGATKIDVDPNDPKQLVKLYERVLPYAILFRQEKEWNKQIGNYYESTQSSPDWYVGAAGIHAFNANNFSSAISSFSSSAANSSTSSGSGGSGSSGGGGGGGGGGGW